MIVELAADNLLSRADDGLGTARIERTECEIGFGRSALDDCQRPDNRERNALFADVEIITRTLDRKSVV